MIFDGELYRDDVNKISYVLGSYQDFLDTRGRFPDLESGTWGGGGATALFGDLGVKGITKAHAIDRLLAHLGANRQDAVAFGDAEVLRAVVQLAELGRVEGKDRRSCGVVQGEDGIQLVLAHVADGDRHSLAPYGLLRTAAPVRDLPGLSHGPFAAAMTFGAGSGRIKEL